ncbi:alpha-xenorhabdolysin family binary toxin subunit B [Providencia vermicola]|uniref:alpha-xenorhabdolysin family binary toxin subunit B n=1 Tax=Providencia vermicola TaxID=333965 RepID=UPI0034DCCB02
MKLTAKSPTLPSIEFYQMRMCINKLSAFNQNILDYDPVIFNRIKNISDKAEILNELVRDSLPIMKLKTRYIINSTINELSPINTTFELHHKHHDLILTEFIDDFSEVKTEIEKLKLSMRSITDYLTEVQLKEENKLKSEYYLAHQNKIIGLETKNKKKIQELNQEINAIVAAEEIILNYKLSDMFEKFFPEIAFIESLNIPPSKKDLLKIAIDCAKRLLVILDNGLDFMKLVDVRLYLIDQMAILHEKSKQYEERNNRLTYFLVLGKEVTQIDHQRQEIAANFQQLQRYFQQWIDYMADCLHEETFNVYNAIESCEVLMEFLVETEYQYQRQLAD